MYRHAFLHLTFSAWRENFLRIKKLVLIGGPDDGVITPWQSSHFGFYDSNETIVEMRNQEKRYVWVEDAKRSWRRVDVPSLWSETRSVALKLHCVQELHREVAHLKT
ncbi:hypothetical protein F7725_018224, partial [Dissostichus mawsoni]